MARHGGWRGPAADAMLVLWLWWLHGAVMLTPDRRRGVAMMVLLAIVSIGKSARMARLASTAMIGIAAALHLQ